MCRIRYLTDVTPETPAFAVVPDSRRFDTLAEAREALEDYHEVPLYAPAGTCILYDNATFHTRLDGTAEPSLPRRTLQLRRSVFLLHLFCGAGFSATAMACTGLSSSALFVDRQHAVAVIVDLVAAVFRLR